MNRADPGAGAGPARQAYALVQTGPLQIGIAAGHVVQAVAWPAALTVLPRGRGALEGVFSHGGQVIPLLSMERWLDGAAPQAPQAARQVLILRSGAKVMGLAVDAVMGLLHASASQVHRVHHDEDAQELFHSVLERDAGTGLVSLLDPERLAARVQAWCEGLPGGTADGGSEADAGEAGAGRVLREVFLIARVGQGLLGFAAREIGEIVPMPLLQKPWGAGTHLGGMARWRGIPVPVVDTAAASGLPASAAEGAAWLLVMSSQGRHAAVPADQLMAVQSFALDDLQAPEAVDTSEGSEGGLSRGSLLHGGERVRIIDSARFLDRFALDGLADAAGGRPEDVVRPGSAGAGSAMLLVFRSLQSWAGAMDPMQQITLFPQQVNWSDDVGRGVLGSFEWRGQSVSLVDLRLLHGQAATVVDAATRVIVLRVGQRLAGLVVEDVVALLPAHSCVHTRFATPTGGAVRMVTTGSGTAQTSYQVMDFNTLDCFSLLAEPAGTAQDTRA